VLIDRQTVPEGYGFGIKDGVCNKQNKEDEMKMRMMKIAGSLIAVLLVCLGQATAGTVTLSGTNLTEDTFLRGDDSAGGTSPANNYGASTSLLVGRLPDGASNQNLGNILLRFDTTSVSNQVVTGATLRLWNQNHAHQTADVAIHAYAVAAANGDWVEGNTNNGIESGASCWRFKIQNTGDWAGGRNGCGVPGTDYLTNLVGSAISSNTTQEWVEFTLDPDAVQNWVDNPNQNYGLVLTAPGALEGEAAYFYSSEMDVSAVPQLVLTTTPKVTETVSFSGTNQVEDVYLRGNDSQSSAPSNFGGTPLLIAGRLNSDVVINALMRFTDLSALSGRTVSNATLRLYNQNHASQTQDVTIHVYEVAAANGDWVEGDYLGDIGWDASVWRFKIQNTVDWAGGRNGCGVPGTDYTTNLVGSALFADTGAEWVDIQLDAAVVQNWINNPGQNYGLLLTSPDASLDGEVVFLDSSESGELGPQLAVEVMIEKSFENWVAGKGLSGEDALAGSDPDSDGMDNLLEYALGGDPNVNDASAVLPASSMVAQSGTNWLEYIYNRRLDAAARGLDYDMILSEDLVAGSWTNIGQSAESGSAPVDDDFETVTNRIATDVSSKFAALEVTEN
jgi:hypothetical protein